MSIKVNVPPPCPPFKAKRGDAPKGNLPESKESFFPFHGSYVTRCVSDRGAALFNVA